MARWVAMMNTLSALRRPSVAAARCTLRNCPLAILAALFAAGCRGLRSGRPVGHSRHRPRCSASAAECTVAPRSEDELRARSSARPRQHLSSTPFEAATPAIAPMGDPADEQTVAEVRATWRQFIACITAGDQARMFAL